MTFFEDLKFSISVEFNDLKISVLRLEVRFSLRSVIDVYVESLTAIKALNSHVENSKFLLACI